MTTHHFFHHREPKKYYPKYFNELLRNQGRELLFITSDFLCLRRFQRLKIVCLYCPGNLSYYDFSFSFDREIWVLYYQPQLYDKSLLLAQTIQMHGASKILLIPIAI